MLEYIVKDRQTGEILCQGTAGKCADCVGCKPSYIRQMAKSQPKYNNDPKAKYSRYKVEVVGEPARGMPRGDVVCVDCGVLMVDVGVATKRCPECAKKHTREMKRNYMHKIRGSTRTHGDTATKNHRGCQGCIYYGGDYYRCCNYILVMGKRRPCPPGKGCTVRKERGKKHG